MQTAVLSGVASFLSEIPAASRGLFVKVGSSLAANATVIQSYQEQLSSALERINPSLRVQLDGAIASLRDANNPARFTNTSNNLRELLRELLAVVAPDALIMTSKWYVSEPEVGVTRRHRIQFAIYGFLSEEFFPNNLIQRVDDLTADLLDRVKSLSKFTHVTEAILRSDESEALELF